MQTAQFLLHSQIEETHWWFTGRREIVRRLIHQVLLPSRGHFLVDIGCGTGGNLAAFASDYHCIGWDPSEEAVRLARERFPALRFLSGPIDQAVGSLSDPPDGILLMDVLEHVEEDAALFAQIVAALRPGGFLLLTVPAGMELWSPHDVSFGHFHRYDRPQLEQIWKGQPVVPLLVSYYNSRLYPVVRSVRFWTQRMGQAAGEAGTDLHLPSAPVNRLLSKIFSSESNVLVPLLKEQSRRSFSHGASLIAVLRKQEGSPDGA